MQGTLGMAEDVPTVGASWRRRHLIQVFRDVQQLGPAPCMPEEGRVGRRGREKPVERRKDNPEDAGPPGPRPMPPGESLSTCEGGQVTSPREGALPRLAPSQFRLCAQLSPPIGIPCHYLWLLESVLALFHPFF